MPFSVVIPATETSPARVSASKPALAPRAEEKQGPENKQAPKPANKSRTTADPPPA
jgi:hypothetical protein